MEKQKCPEIRFSGFIQSWNEIRLGSITYCYSGGTPSVGIKSFYGGDIPFIRSGEINGDNTKLFLTEDGVENSSAKLVKKGDVLYALYGATSGEVSLSLINGAINQAVLAIIPNHLMQAEFIVYWLKKSKLEILSNYLQGGQGNLSAEIVKNLLVDIPSPFEESEQTQIGNFFQNLDQFIALNEKKLNQTQNLKKAMLEKMFPQVGSKQPEIRLKDFSGDWEEQPLESIFAIIRNAFVGTATPYYVKKGNFYLESNNVKDGRINRKSQIFINDYFYYEQKDKWLKANDLVMVQSGHVGHSAVITEELHNSAAHALIMFSDYKVRTDAYFLNYQLQTHTAKIEIEKITTGNTIKHILSSDMKKFISLFPCYEEQTKIGQLFKQLDETLVLQQQQLQSLKNLKQAFLEKMFV